MAFYLIFSLIIFLAIVFILYRGFKLLRKNVPIKIVRIEFIILFSYLISILSFCIFNLDTRPYYERIDPIDFTYEAFAQKYILGIFLFYFAFLFSAIAIWLKNSKIPPLFSVLCHSFLFIQFIISLFCIYQIIFRNLDEFPYSTDASLEMSFGYLIFILNIIISIILFIKTIRTEVKFSKNRRFNNKFLNNLNLFLSKSYNYYPAIIILAFPLYLVVSLILVLFGQDFNSMTKVFTETTNWALSQKEHPPYLDHNGHYLCTVAACGTPKLVKPLFVGERHHNKIIVNRQLQIANAFEEIIQVKFPKIHKVIRNFYDKYGYNLSKKITGKFWSDFTYILMKPLELLFLVFIYMTETEPEKMIKKQYNRKEYLIN